MSKMLDRGDQDELLPDCPWTKEDGLFCDAHDVELSYGEDDEGQEFRYCHICNECIDEEN